MNVSQLIDHAEGAIAKALAGESLLDPEVLNIRGFSTPTQRRLANNLCRVPGGMHYLEVGLWHGGTFCAAMSNNPELTITGVENESQDFSEPGVWAILKANLAKYGGAPKRMNMIWADFKDAAPTIKGPIDCYFFDGEHGFANQAAALPTMLHAMADHFLFLVDDAAWTPVRDGTAEGFNRLKDKVKVEWSRYLSDGQAPDGPVWHNDVALYICSKI